MNLSKLLVLQIVVWAFAQWPTQVHSQEVRHYISVDEYNAEQKRRAKELSRDLVKQVGNTCQTTAAIGLAYLTGLIPSPHKVYMPDVKKDMSPTELHAHLMSQGVNPGHHLESLVTAFNPGTTYTSFSYDIVEKQVFLNSDAMGDKIRIIADALDDGRPVYIGLMALPIWEGYFRDMGMEYDATLKERFYKNGHVLIAIGVKRDQEGDVLGFYLRDSGTGTSYYSNASDFTQSLSVWSLDVNGLNRRATEIAVPGRRGVEKSGKVLTPMKFVSLTGEWENLVDGSRLNAFYTPSQRQLMFSFKKPPSYRADDDIHGWIMNTANGDRYMRKAFTFHGCAMPAEEYPVVVERTLDSARAKLSIRIQKVPAGRVYPERNCTKTISGTQEIIYNKVNTRLPGWKKDPFPVW